MGFDFSQIERKLNAVSEAAQGELIGAAAQIAKDDIIERTLSGADVEENEFMPYKPYQRRKREAAGLITERVTLSFTGQMLEDIHDREGEAGGDELFFSDAYVDIARGNQEKWDRNFFGVNEITLLKEEQGLLPKVQEILDR